MCSAPKIETPTIQSIGSQASDAAVREGEMERRLRRNRNGSAADILTSPLGLVGNAMGGA